MAAKSMGRSPRRGWIAARGGAAWPRCGAMWRTIADVSELAQDVPALFALSGFDGVHHAHQRLIQRARELADDAGAQLVLATCWPPLPDEPDAPLPSRVLTTRVERADLLRALAGDAALLDLDLPPAAAGFLPSFLVQRVARHSRVTVLVARAELAAALEARPGMLVI